MEAVYTRFVDTRIKAYDQNKVTDKKIGQAIDFRKPDRSPQNLEEEGVLEVGTLLELRNFVQKFSDDQIDKLVKSLTPFGQKYFSAQKQNWLS